MTTSTVTDGKIANLAHQRMARLAKAYQGTQPGLSFRDALLKISHRDYDEAYTLAGRDEAIEALRAKSPALADEIEAR